MKTLALDLRSLIVNLSPARNQRSFRIDVIAGLSAAFPKEYLLMPPLEPPESDVYYEKIEHWARSRLGVPWDTPRPPFFHEVLAPIPSPR